jgi:hypothetical protein
MAQNIFISYSRREVGFIDGLVSDLEEKGHQVWLDYRNLIPGTPWQDQIYHGIQKADVILLVVSKASLGSQNVEVEWRRVLDQNKRIILIIFEAVDLPPELEKYEWVDFRGKYKAGLSELLSQIDQPINEDHPVPQTGFKVPGIVWIAAILASFAAFLSLFSLWSIFIPWVLIPLPIRIFRRDFNYSLVQTALLILPVTLMVSGISVTDESTFDLLVELFLWSIPLVISLVLVLRSKGMQRWGKEQATRPTFANRLKPESENTKSVSFYIDHAPEDGKIARELEKALLANRHEKAASINDANSVFVVLSQLKDDTSADPERQFVYPLVIQTGTVSKKLSHIQWIDLRPGVRKLDMIAALLNEPAKLLKTLGNRPRGNQLILPPPVLMMYYFLILLGVFLLGTFFKIFYELYFSNISDDAFFTALDSSLIPFAVIILLSGGLIYMMLRALLNRKGGLASFTGIGLTLLLLGILITASTVYAGFIVEAIEEFETQSEASFAVNVVLFPIAVYVLGVFTLSGFMLFRFKDIALWLPVKNKNKGKG